MINLGSALVYLGANASGLDKDLQDAKTKTTGWAGNLGGTAAKLIGGGIVAGAAAAGAAIAGIGSVAFDTANTIDTATGKVQSQLGAAGADAEKLGSTIKGVYGNNFGETIEDVGQAVADTALQMDRFGTMSQEELQAATEKAIALRDAFGEEVNATTSAANTLMEEFGLSSDDAFTFIQSGMQNGLNASGDFLDSIGEYAVQFKDGGATADQFFSTLSTGLRGGMLGTDKAADAFKEFRVRIQDGSETTRMGLEQLGIPVDDFLAKLASGEMTEMAAFAAVQEGLRNVDDEAVQMQAGVALIGTQFEDLGTEAALALDPMAMSMEDIEGQTSDLNKQYDNLGTMFEGLKRKVAVGLEPLGRKLLDLADRILPRVEPLITGLFEKLGPIVEGVADTLGRVFDTFFGKLDEGKSPLEALKETLAEFIPPEVMAIIDQVVAGLGQLVTWGKELGEFIMPILGEAFAFVKDHMNVFGPILGVIVGLIVALNAPILAVVGLIALLATAWANNWGGIQDKVAAVIAFIKPIIEGLIAFFEGVWAGIQEVFAAFKLGFEGDWRGMGEALRRIWDRIWTNIKNAVGNAWAGIRAKLAELIDRVKGIFSDTDWGELGRGIIDGIISAITNGIAAVGGAIRNLANNALDAAKGFLGIESPSKVMAKEVGQPMVAGIAEGLSASGALKKAMGALFGDATDLSANLATSLAGAGGLSYGDIYVTPGGADQPYQYGLEVERSLRRHLRQRGRR